MVVRNITNAVALDPFETLPSFLWTAACILISGICIYQLNFRLALKKAVPDTAIRKKLALSLAVFTAPYLIFTSHSMVFLMTGIRGNVSPVSPFSAQLNI